MLRGAARRDVTDMDIDDVYADDMVPPDWESDPFFRQIVEAEEFCEEAGYSVSLCRWVRAKQLVWEVERLQSWFNRPSPMVQ